MGENRAGGFSPPLGRPIEFEIWQRLRLAVVIGQDLAGITILDTVIVSPFKVPVSRTV